MTSIGGAGRSIRNVALGYFIPLGNCADKILQYTPGSGAGGSYLNGSFAAAAWAQGGSQASRWTSTISTIAAGGVLRDEGKTVVSAGRVFRKVQLLVNSVSTGGVGGPLTPAGTSANTDYLTGYIEVANTLAGPGVGPAGGSAAPAGALAPVAYYPQLF